MSAHDPKDTAKTSDEGGGSLTAEHRRVMAEIDASPEKKAAFEAAKELQARDPRRPVVAPSMLEEMREDFEKEEKGRARHDHARERFATKPEPIPKALLDVSVPPVLDGNGKAITQPVNIDAPIVGTAEEVAALVAREQEQMRLAAEPDEPGALLEGRRQAPTEPRGAAPEVSDAPEIAADANDETALSRKPSSRRASSGARWMVFAAVAILGAGAIAVGANALRSPPLDAAANSQRTPTAPAPSEARETGALPTTTIGVPPASALEPARPVEAPSSAPRPPHSARAELPQARQPTGAASEAPAGAASSSGVAPPSLTSRPLPSAPIAAPAPSSNVGLYHD
jgi:hypothetical protein